MMIAAAFALGASLSVATPCETLKSLPLPNATITAAELLPAGPFTTGRGQAEPTCRRAAAWRRR
jgi:hypothetical protein